MRCYVQSPRVAHALKISEQNARVQFTREVCAKYPRVLQIPPRHEGRHMAKQSDHAAACSSRLQSSFTVYSITGTLNTPPGITAMYAAWFALTVLEQCMFHVACHRNMTFVAPNIPGHTASYTSSSLNTPQPAGRSCLTMAKICPPCRRNTSTKIIPRYYNPHCSSQSEAG